ncbi:ATP-binding protein [Thalassococcus sp. CAU 1522]|uniref:ATP-binding protein n=1 Tax=Thalassococcus arenae TaxID=2851652 RepID=A0ABS6N9D6_9RHOB|nr:ATP-binding protein [Thalassococcus arenae]MBV2360165.1 ATP-binding protein [Thalassococcus arenae]
MSLRLSVGDTPGDVRRALADMRGAMLACGCPVSVCDRLEIVLAEALNNVVEHALSGCESGTISLLLRCRDGRVRAELRDRGTALPDRRIPDAVLPDPNVPIAELPEGGFGWFLIRALTDNVEYTRCDGENRLLLELALDSGRV